MSPFTEKEKIQDDQYCFPYHYLDKQLEFYRRIKHADYLSLINKIIEAVQPVEGMRLLDVGCGDGRLCHELSGRGIELLGVDHSVRAINFAIAFCPECRFIVCDIVNLDYKQYFDVIAMVEVLEHLPPAMVPVVIDRLWRALKGDGRLVVSVPTTNLSLGEKHYQHFTVESLLESIGPQFEVESVKGHLEVGRPWRRFLALQKWAELLWPLRNKPGVEKFLNYVENYYHTKLELCSIEEAGRLIVLFRKIDTK